MRRYLVEERLGVGGMGEVFRARQRGAEGFSRPVALKRISSALSHDERFASLFIAEARIAALLAHPNIVTVFDFDRDEDGALFLAMELVDGADLRRLLEGAAQTKIAVPPPTAAFVAGEVLRALAYAHAFAHDGRPLGIVHRDVSPHNVLVSRSGIVKLSDFGIAKATAVSLVSSSDAIRGKVAYLSPEQASSKPLDGRCDLYAVGVMLYELLSGTRPYHGKSEAEVLAQVLLGRPLPLGERAPAIPSDLAAFTMRLFAPDREERYATAYEAIDALRACGCFPKHGEVDLSLLVRTVLPAPVEWSSATSTDRTTIPRSAHAARSTSTTGRVRRSGRSLTILGVMAVLSSAAAVWAWVLPRTSPRRLGPAAVVRVPAPEVTAIPGDASLPTPTPAYSPTRSEKDARTPWGRGGPRPGKDDRAPTAREDASTSSTATTRLSASLDSGTISVRVRPWGIVTVDGVKWGLTPVTRAVPLGKRRVTIKNDDLGRVENLVLDVQPGQRIALERDWE